MAGVHRVCLICQSLQEKNVTIQEARGVILVHSEC